MPKKKTKRGSQAVPHSPREFQKAYLKACSEPGWKPDPKKLFATFPAARADALPLSKEDRELLVEVGLPFQFSMNGMYGSIQFAGANDRLLKPLAEVCPDYEDRDFTNQVLLAEFGAVEEDHPDYLCWSIDTGYIWLFNWLDGSWTFVNSSLMQFARCLYLLRILSTSMIQLAEKSLLKSDDDEIDMGLLKNAAEKSSSELQTIDPDCVELDAMWPQVIAATLSWWGDRDLPLFGTRPKAPPEVDDRPLAKLLPDLIDSSDYFTGPKLTKKMIQSAEKKLGYKLPESYLQLLRIKNGVSLTRECFPTEESTSWSSDHVQIIGIEGIGGKQGIDVRSHFMIKEWGYPDVGIVIGATPSSGHTTVMLDYSECGPKGEPRVIWVAAAEFEDDDNRILVLAPDFESFLRGLKDCDEF